MASLKAAESTDIISIYFFRFGAALNVFVMVRSDKWQDFAYLNLTNFYLIQTKRIPIQGEYLRNYEKTSTRSPIHDVI
jgi:hypothetical protein